MEIFLELLKLGDIDKVSVDADQADSLLHLLDAVVIKLEGGTEEDLQILNVKPLKPIITKDILREKEEQKRKSSTEKKSENRYYMIYIKYFERDVEKNINYISVRFISARKIKQTIHNVRRKIKAIRMLVRKSKLR